MKDSTRNYVSRSAMGRAEHATLEDGVSCVCSATKQAYSSADSTSSLKRYGLGYRGGNVLTQFKGWRALLCR